MAPANGNGAGDSLGQDAAADAFVALRVSRLDECSIIEALVRRVADEVKRRGATAVHRIRVCYGELSGVNPALLATAYETLRAATVCENAALELAMVPARWACRVCARPIEEGAPLECDVCGVTARMVSGDEIVLEEIDLEVP